MPLGIPTSIPPTLALRSGFAAVAVAAVGATLLLPGVQSATAGLPIAPPLLAGALLGVAALASWTFIVRPALRSDGGAAFGTVPALSDIELRPVLAFSRDQAALLPSTEKLHVFVADADPYARLAAEAMLLQLGHVVDMCGDGETAVARVVDAAYDVVLMDIQLPHMSGIEACKALRTLMPDEKRPTIIALTSQVDDGASERYRAAGFDDLLTKPLMLNFLTRALAKGDEATVSDLDAPAAETPDAAYIVRSQTAECGDSHASDAAEMLRAMIRNHVTELVGEEDPEFVEELTSTFLESATGILARAAEAAATNDLDGIRAAAHQFRGSASNVGLRMITDAWTPVENAARGGDEAGVEGALPNALHKTRRALEFLAA